MRRHRFGMAAAFALCMAAASATVAQEVQRVLCIGDSITAAADGWVAMVGANDKIDTINAGAGGRQTWRAAETFEKNVQQEFDRVVFFLGVNNLPARDTRPMDEKVAICVTTMGQGIDAALTKLKPKDVILVAPCGVNAETMSPLNRAKGYHVCQEGLEKLEVAYKKLAEEKGVQFLSLLHVVSKENFSDGLHPNADGHKQIAEAVTEFLLKTR